MIPEKPLGVNKPQARKSASEHPPEACFRAAKHRLAAAVPLPRSALFAGADVTAMRASDLDIEDGADHLVGGLEGPGIGTHRAHDFLLLDQGPVAVARAGFITSLAARDLGHVSLQAIDLFTNPVRGRSRGVGYRLGWFIDAGYIHIVAFFDSGFRVSAARRPTFVNADRWSKNADKRCQKKDIDAPASSFSAVTAGPARSAASAAGSA